MQSFLNRVAQEVLKAHGNHLGDVAIVLPNRRSHLFLQQEFSKQIQKNTWAPQLFSLEDFIDQLSGLQVIDSIDLSFELYQVHCAIEGKKAEAFEDFINWAGILLQDFNEIDRHLVNANELYGFLSEARAIETWNLGEEKLSPFQENYLRFWSKLTSYYTQFRKHLLDRGLAYQGLSFRIAAEQCKEKGKSEFTAIYFAGFNAFTQAEQELVEHYIETENAFLWFDADDYYIRDKNQEAGHFLRKHFTKHPRTWVEENIKKGKAKFKVYGVPGNIAQAKLAGTLLKDQSEMETALVLADENMLVPVLDGLPEGIDKVNVTMGYPLSNSPLYDFFKSFFELHAPPYFEGEAFSNKKLGEFLQHPIWETLTSEIKNATQALIDSCKEDHWGKMNASTLLEFNNRIGISLFQQKEHHTDSILAASREFLKLYMNFLHDNQKLEGEIAYQFQSTFQRLLSLTKDREKILSSTGLFQLFVQLIPLSSVSFIGEPLSGLQIMGVLESRVLDFKRIIVTSMNEGVLPAGKSQNSFIPYDIKKKFGLPSYKEKDAIFAYHFYRLIQRAEEVHLLYNTKKEGIGSAEKSRFILQLEEEIRRYEPEIEFQNIPIKTCLPAGLQLETIIKSEAVKNDLLKRFQSGLSASALNCLISCPLDYYYSKVLKLEESNPELNELEHYEFGNIIHRSLEIIYREHQNTILDQKSFQSMKTQIKPALDQAFLEETSKIPNSGYRKIAYEVGLQYIKRVIEMDQSDVSAGNEILLLDLEMQFDSVIKLDGPIKSLRLKGTIDRIEKRNGELRIIDYKTGGLSSGELKINQLEDCLKTNKSKALQLLIYQAAIQEQYPESKAGIVSMKSEFCEFVPLEMKKEESSNTPQNRMEFLSTMIETVLDNCSEIKHDPSSKYCKFC